MPSKLARKNVGIAEIRSRIYQIRGMKVMLDSDLADLYGVKTSALNRAVKRNIDRFPEDFMFQLEKQELTDLMCQIGTSSSGSHGGRRTMPFVFTQEGVAMLSGVLSSQKAIEVNIAIMRAFVNLRDMLISHEDLSRKLMALERKFDGQFKTVFQVIRQLMEERAVPRKQIIGLSDKAKKKTPRKKA